MRDDDELRDNPHVSLRALQAVHEDLFGWCLSRCDYEPAAAEDLLQQTYVEVLSGRARFDARSALKTFLFGVAHNLARSRFRRKALRLRLLRSYAFTTEVATSGSAADIDDDNEKIWRAVAALPARQRDITELVFCRDMTIEQASAVMGVAVGTGRVHYERAKKALATKLGTMQDWTKTR